MESPNLGMKQRAGTKHVSYRKAMPSNFSLEGASGQEITQNVSRLRKAQEANHKRNAATSEKPVISGISPAMSRQGVARKSSVSKIQS